MNCSSRPDAEAGGAGVCAETSAVAIGSATRRRAAKQRFIIKRILFHQTRHAVGRTIGASALHEKAFRNSDMFESGPLTRYLLDEWGLVAAFNRSVSGLAFSHQTCAQPRKTRCSGVKPSTLSLLRAPGPERYAMSVRRRPPLSAVFSPRGGRPVVVCAPAPVCP